jgi:hypothetical protein
MTIADSHGLPVAISTHEASTHEVKLVEKTLSGCFARARPKRLMGYMTYDSDPLDQTLSKRGISMIAPHKANRVKPATQDARELRRYKKDGRFKGCLPGYSSLEDAKHDLTTMTKITLALFNSLASLFYSETTFEICSN